MSISIRFVGGPADGRTCSIPDERLPPLYLIPAVPPLSDFLASPDADPAPIPVVEYEPVREGGWPRRADDGAYLYRHRVPPVSPEERARLGQARRVAQAVRERREAELDETWREIRKERPHLPEDRRDLF